MKNSRAVIPFTFAFLLILFTWIACSKSSSGGGSNGPSATVKLIIQSPWKYDFSGVDLNRDGVADIPDTSITACQKDNTYTFKADSTGTMDEGPTKCVPTDPQTVPFHWQLTNNESVITSTANPILAGGVNILTINSTKFEVYKDSIVGGFSVRYVLSLKH